MNDRSLGLLLGIVSLSAILTYTWCLFIASDSPIYGRPLWWWALAAPVYAIVLFFFAVLVWIGWAMATTSPPTPPEEPKSK